MADLYFSTKYGELVLISEIVMVREVNQYSAIWGVFLKNGESINVEWEDASKIIHYLKNLKQ